MGETKVHVRSFYILLMPILFCCNVIAAEIAITLVNQNNKNLKNYAIALYPEIKPESQSMEKMYVIKQKDKAFNPKFNFVQVGTEVSFPNMDETAHSVYSFSKAKKFNLELYKREEKTPSVKFDQEGVVIFGCNIHDWMVGYLVIFDTPYFAYVENGAAKLTNLPAGRYSVKYWQSEVDSKKINTVSKKLSIKEGSSANIKLKVTVKDQEDFW